MQGEVGGNCDDPMWIIWCAANRALAVRPGDFIAFFAEIDLLDALSACPGGDCSATHSSEAARCWPLKVEVWRGREE